MIEDTQLPRPCRYCNVCLVGNVLVIVSMAMFCFCGDVCVTLAHCVCSWRQAVLPRSDGCKHVCPVLNVVVASMVIFVFLW